MNPFVRAIIYLGLVLWIGIYGGAVGLFRNLPSVQLEVGSLIPIVLMLVVIIFGFVSPTPKKRWMFVPGFFLVLAWTCWLYSTLGGNSDIDPLRTLIHICAWSILPAWIGFCCFAIGNIVIARVFSARKQPTLISEKVGLGLAAVLLALVTLSISVSTNTYVLIAFFFVISIPGILHGIHIIDSCIRRSKETNSGQTIRGPELIMWIVACFLGSAFLIHVLRPIPLGWDDLNVYMNIVKSISLGRSIPDNAGMVPWAVFLSSGYTLGGATQSFFFSTMVTFLSGLAMYEFLYHRRKSSFFAITGCLILFASPMIQFLSSIDLKVDMAVLFLGIVSMMQLMRITTALAKKKGIHLIEWGLLGFLLGSMFAIKFTGLYLILASLSVIGFVLWGAAGLTFFVTGFLFLGGLLGLLPLMHIDIQPSDIVFHVLSGICTVTSAYGVFQRLGKNSWTKYLASFLVLLVCCILPALPWITKHAYQSILAQTPFQISTILHGHDRDTFRPAFGRIEIKNTHTIETPAAHRDRSHLRCGIVESNEDYNRFSSATCGIGRYINSLGYTTFFVAQLGDLSNPSILFFVLFFFMVLSPRSSHTRFVIGVAGSCVLLMLSNPNGFVSQILRPILTYPIFPYGYLLIGLGIWCIGWVGWRKQQDVSTRLLIVLTCVYAFFWLISSYFIPWYGILLFVLMIVLFFGTPRTHDKAPEKRNPMAVVTWYVIVFHIVIYAIIQPLGNLSQTGLHEYKNGRQSAEVAFASSFPQLITPLIFLNIATDHISDFLQHPNLEELLSPTDEKRNQKKIYRVGTFLRYFISDNQTRVFDDYLLERYKKFIFDPDPKIVHERLRELNVDYVLIDPNLGTLNTANIPELQKRYEDTLVSLRGTRTPLISTDNICVRLAYILPDLPENDFRTLVSVQYHTPPVSNEQKKSACIDLVGQLLKSSSEFTGPLRFLETYRNTQDLPARIAQELGSSYVILFEVGE